MLIRCRSQSWVSRNPASFNLQSRECLQAQLLVCDCRAVGPGDCAERQACPATDPARPTCGLPGLAGCTSHL